MLAALDIRLYPTEDCQLPHPSAHLIHAALLRLIQKEDHMMSFALHEDAQVKPFSISTLWPRTRAFGDNLVIPKYTECKIRVCSIGKPVFDAFAKPIFERTATHGSIELQGHPFVFLEASMEGPDGGACCFSDLFTCESNRYALKFVSPTTFRRKGLNVPLPDPQLVYGSLWQKWQALSDIQVSESTFEEMSSVLAITAMRVNTRLWKFPRFMMNGFVGIAEFELTKPVSKDALSLFNALTKLSFYTGIGYRTTMGMGQCRILPDYLMKEENQDAET